MFYLTQGRLVIRPWICDKQSFHKLGDIVEQDHAWFNNKSLPPRHPEIFVFDSLSFTLKSTCRSLLKGMKTSLEDFSIHMEEIKKALEEDWELVMQ